MKHLPHILALQRNLVKRFQNVAVLTGTIKEFLNTQSTGRETVSSGNRGSLFSKYVSCSYVMAFYFLRVRRWAESLVQETHRDLPDNLESAPSLSGDQR